MDDGATARTTSNRGRTGPPQGRKPPEQYPSESGATLWCPWQRDHRRRSRTDRRERGRDRVLELGVVVHDNVLRVNGRSTSRVSGRLLEGVQFRVGERVHSGSAALGYGDTVGPPGP